MGTKIKERKLLEDKLKDCDAIIDHDKEEVEASEAEYRACTTALAEHANKDKPQTDDMDITEQEGDEDNFKAILAAQQAANEELQNALRRHCEQRLREIAQKVGLSGAPEEHLKFFTEEPPDQVKQAQAKLDKITATATSSQKTKSGVLNKFDKSRNKAAGEALKQAQAAAQAIKTD